jgi:DNA-binding IclR family transcriptional regulator
MASYPLPGTNAERILNFVQENPGTTRNRIIEKLDMNPSVVKGAITTLTLKGLVLDKPDERSHHHYHARGPKL